LPIGSVATSTSHSLLGICAANCVGVIARVWADGEQFSGANTTLGHAMRPFVASRFRQPGRWAM
jgi:hypothetical protein